MKSPLLPILLAAGSAIAAGYIRNKSIPAKRIIAAFLFGAVIYGLAEVNADMAVTLAWVAALTSLLINGQIVASSVTKGL